MYPGRPPSRAASHTSRLSVVSRGGVSLYSVGSVHSVKSTVARSQVGFSAPEEQWRPPVLSTALFTTIPRASHVVAIYSICQAIFTIITSAFDIYVLAEAEPGKEHFGYYIISFEFVYAGNPHVRRCLMVLGLVSGVLGIFLLVFSCILLHALRQENELRMRPWLLAMFFHTVWRLFAFVFAALVNDLYFVYHGLMCFLWAVMVPANVYGWLVVWSMFNELTEVSRLEDIANIKMGTMTSLSGLRAPSISVQPCSRPITPHSYRTDARPSVSSYHSLRRPSAYSIYNDPRPSVSRQSSLRPPYPDERRASDTSYTECEQPLMPANGYHDDARPQVRRYHDEPV